MASTSSGWRGRTNPGKSSRSGALMRNVAARACALCLRRALFDQNPPHGLCRRGEEVTAMVPVLIRRLAYQAGVGLVNQGGGLKRLAGFLLGHLPGGQLTKLPS